MLIEEMIVCSEIVWQATGNVNINSKFYLGVYLMEKIDDQCV